MSVREEIRTLWTEKSRLMNGKVRLCSQVRICRNLQGYPFPVKASSTDRQAISSILLKALGHRMRPKKDWLIIPWNTCTEIERRILTRICSLDFPCEETVIVFHKKGLGVFIINDGDALRIQGMNHYNLYQLWNYVNTCDDKLQKYLPYAFDPEKGYATASPSNYGTGLDIRSLVHIPALCFKQKLIQIQEALKVMQLRMEPVEFVGDKILGHLFYVTHDVAQGCSEADLVKHVDDVTQDIVKQEEALRTHLWKENANFMRDSISRAIGVLKSCYELTFEEGMNLISVVLMGMDMGLIPEDGRDALLSLWALMPYGCHVMCRLYRMRRQQCHTGLTRCHNIRMIAKDR